MFGPWKKITEGYGKMVLGYFGKTPCEPDKDIIKLASEQLGLEPTTETVVDLNDKDPNKGIEAAKKMLAEANLEQTEENIFIAAACKEKGIAFLQGHGTIGVRKNTPSSTTSAGKSDAYTVKVNGKNYAVKFEGNKAVVNGKTYDVSLKEGIDSSTPAHHSEGETEVKSPLPGAIMRIVVSEGDHVDEGDTLLVIEAMKMETDIKAPKSGVVSSISVSSGEQVVTGQTLVSIN